MPYNWNKFGCDWSIMTGTLLEKQSTFLLYVTYYRRNLTHHNYHSLSMPYNWYKFGCDQSITKGTLLEEQSTYSAVSHLLLDRSFGNSTLSITMHALNWFGSYWSVTRGT
jgi:hypothetical protein